MSGFAILGFDKQPMFRFSAMLGAIQEFGELSMKLGVIKHPTIIGERVVCVRVADFGAIFTPAETARLSKTAKRTESLPKFARQFAHALQQAADDAAYEAERAKARMI